MSGGALMLTGGAGFLARWVAIELARRGEQPVLFDIAENNPQLPFKHAYWRGDILSAQAVEQCIRAYRVRRIIHTAFISEPLMAQADPHLADHVHLNVHGTLTVLEAARRHDLDVIFLSSKSVYGKPLSSEKLESVPIVREQDPKAPVDLYGSTKLACEQLLSAYRRTFGLDYAIVRFATLWGPGKAKHYAHLAPHSRMIEAAFQGVPYRLERGGQQPDDMIYVKDAAAGIATLALARALDGEDFNLGMGRLQRIGDLATFLQQQFPDWSVGIGVGGNYLNLTDSGAGYYFMETAKAKSVLGFQPVYDLCHGALDYIEWLHQQ